MTDRIKLGDMVRDKTSELEGRVVAITYWIYGCERISIQPIGSKDGKPFESFSVDEPDVELISVTAEPAAAPRHGPRPEPQRGR